MGSADFAMHFQILMHCHADFSVCVGLWNKTLDCFGVVVIFKDAIMP
jgi:hypothetical protein